MVAQFEGLSEQEQQQLLDALPLITILVAGADGDIDKQEVNAARKAAQVRAYHEDTELLHDYYEMIEDTVDERMNSYLNLLSKDSEERVAQVSEELAKLNAVLPKLEVRYGAALYDSFMSFSKYIAEASGGFLKYLSIGPKEHKVYKLPMVTPIVWEDAEEEE